MMAVSLGATRADEAVRVVKALGAHRYVAGRLHLAHAFAFAATPDADGAPLGAAKAWAREVLSTPDVDAASRDERLWRRSSEAEIAAVLEAFWIPGPRRDAARHALRAFLTQHELPVPSHAPFDEGVEDAVHPLLVDAGWELLGLRELDPTRHRGAMDAFGSALAFESAAFEEDTAMPRPTHLYELPALGAVELLEAADDDGALAEPLVVWVEGHETYLDYVLRGVRRAAKLPERDPDG